MVSAKSIRNPKTVYDRLFRYAEFLKFGDLHMRLDHKTGLKAIIAIHSLKRGPAIGGCRWVEYDSTDYALHDALRLAQMMSYKAAITNLPHGGGKSVLMKPKKLTDKKAYFQAFGRFLNELNGRYITAVDVGTSESEMDLIGTQTKYVTCTSGQGDPGKMTALGVLKGILASVHYKLKRDDLEGVHVAIQGAGHVGATLANYLIEQGALVSICDVNKRQLAPLQNIKNITIVDPQHIFDIDCDVFSPCAMGGVITLEVINQLKASIIAGSANNQLSHREIGQFISERNILYAPDFLINAGGLIKVASNYSGIEICPHFKSRKNLWYLGWDVASGCIWDISIVKCIGLITQI